MINITIRHLNLGIFLTCILIFVQILFGLTFLPDFIPEHFYDLKNLIMQVAYTGIYVSIILLIRIIVIKNESIVNFFIWIICVEIISGLRNILNILEITQQPIVGALVGYVLIALYVILLVKILHQKYDEKPEISLLRPYIIALISIFVIAGAGSIYAELQVDIICMRFLNGSFQSRIFFWLLIL